MLSTTTYYCRRKVLLISKFQYHKVIQDMISGVILFDIKNNKCKYNKKYHCRIIFLITIFQTQANIYYLQWIFIRTSKILLSNILNWVQMFVIIQNKEILHKIKFIIIIYCLLYSIHEKIICFYYRLKSNTNWCVNFNSICLKFVN